MDEGIISGISFPKFSIPLPRWLSVPVIGLDISDRTFKYLRLKHKKDGYVVEQFGQGTIPAGVVVSGEVKDADALAGALRERFQEMKKEKLYAAFSLPEEHGFIRTVTLPRMDVEDARNALRLQLEELVPLKGGEAAFDFTVVDEGRHGNVLDVVLSAFPLPLLNAYIAALESAGLRPVVAEAESQALTRVVVPKTERGSIMVVDAGFTRSSIFIAYERVVRFTSTVNISGAGMTRAIMQDMKIDEEEATRLKRSFTFDKAADAKLYEVLMPSVERLRTEIAKRLAFWEARGGADTQENRAFPAVRKIYLAGGESHMRGFAEYLSDALGVAVERAEPWKNVFDLDTYIPPISSHDMLFFGTALGLALRQEE